MGKVQAELESAEKELGDRATCTEGKISNKITIKQSQRLRNKNENTKYILGIKTTVQSNHGKNIYKDTKP
jgi:hypothetical protein